MAASAPVRMLPRCGRGAGIRSSQSEGPAVERDWAQKSQRPLLPIKLAATSVEFGTCASFLGLGREGGSLLPLKPWRCCESAWPGKRATPRALQKYANSLDALQLCTQQGLWVGTQQSCFGGHCGIA